MNKLIKMVFSKWYLLTGLLLLVLLVMPANSPIGIPPDYKIIPAAMFVLILFWIFACGKKGTTSRIVCMHCKKLMGFKDGKGVEGDSGSICEECWYKEYPEYGPYPGEKNNIKSPLTGITRRRM